MKILGKDIGKTYFRDINTYPVMPWDICKIRLRNYHTLKAEYEEAIEKHKRYKEICERLEESNKIRAAKHRKLRQRYVFYTAKLQMHRKTLDGIRNAIIEGNLRLIVKCAIRFSGRGVPASSLVSVGNMAIFHAIDKWEFGKGTRFSTWASIVIATHMKEAIYNQQPVSLGRSMSYRINWVIRARTACLANGVTNPKPNDIAEYLNEHGPAFMRDKWTYRIVDLALQREPNKQVMALDTLQENCGFEIPCYDDEPPSEEIEQLLMAMNKHLNYRERYILESYYGIGGSRLRLKDIGRHLHLTKERVRQIRDAAIGILYSVFKSDTILAKKLSDIRGENILYGPKVC